MDEHLKQLQQYIARHREQGFTDDRIRETLLAHGWDSAMVAHGMGVRTDGAGHAPAKYKLFRALADSIRAFGANPLAYIVCVVVAVMGAAGIVFGLSALFASIMIATGTGPAHSRAITAGAITLLLAVYVVIWLVSSLLVSVTSLALNDGAEKRTSAIWPLLRTALQRLPRVIGASALMGIITSGPIVLIAIFGIVSILSSFLNGAHYSASPVFAIGIILAMIAALIWSLVAILRYTLMPLIALFEPQTPLLQTPRRSYHLMRRGGQWFLMKACLLVLLIAVILSALTNNKINQLEQSNNWGVIAILILLDIMYSAALVMLYRNRRVVRGTA